MNGQAVSAVFVRESEYPTRDDGTVDEQPVFTDPWWDLRRGGPVERNQRDALQAELLTEVAHGHPLHNQPVVVVAKSEASDDIVIRLAAGGWARVHLTWKGAPEAPPWPWTEFYDTVQTLERSLREED